MVKGQPHLELGRRERQIMDIVFRLGKASVAEVLKELPDPPSYSSVRGMLGLLEDKGYVHHQQDGLRYVYLPTAGQQQAQHSALRHMVHTFFGGSASEAAASLLELPDSKLSASDVARLKKLIKQAKSEGR
ncbi:MAG: putative transcriptional regulator [Acidobacteriales bacterium]|nr:putative transcriptional regulator [Terriglobales bacterium]